MQPLSIQQEILLMTNTTFSQQQLTEKDASSEMKQFMIAEQLEEACWDGLLEDTLPGIVDKSGDGKRLFLWEMKHCDDCIQIELGEYPEEIEPWYSINPHNFLATTYYS